MRVSVYAKDELVGLFSEFMLLYFIDLDDIFGFPSLWTGLMLDSNELDDISLLNLTSSICACCGAHFVACLPSKCGIGNGLLPSSWSSRRLDH